MDERLILTPKELAAVILGSHIAVNMTHGSPISLEMLRELANNAAQVVCGGHQIKLLKED